MTRERDYSLTVALVCVGILMIICALVATGCNTIDGIGRDLQVASRSTAETER